jgi:hypothetical protein
MTEREIMGLHAEVNALRERYGISYKNASSRLYMAEVEKVKTDDHAKKAFSALVRWTCDALDNLQEKLGELECEESEDKEGGGA